MAIGVLTPAQTLATLRTQYRLVLITMLPFTIIGILYAFLKPSSYQVNISVMPELQTRSALNLKRFGALAELAGIELDASGGVTEAVRPDLYPNVLSSRTFLLYLLNQPVETTTHQKYSTLVAFLTAPQRNWLNRLLYSNQLTIPELTSTNQPLALNRDQEDLLKDVYENIRSDLDKQSGLILIRAEMPDARVAAQVAQLSINYLKQYVTDYRTDKLRQTLAFLTAQLQQTRARHADAQRQLARYQDEHRYTVLQTASLEARELEANVSVARTVLDDLTRQFEQTHLRIQEETPVFKILEQPYIPARRSSPHRKAIVLWFMLVGLIAGSAITLSMNKMPYSQ